MNKIYIIIIFLFLSIQCKSQINSINEASFIVKSIDINDEDFSDLQALKEYIGDTRIVMMGETTHDDGSTLYARTRITKFLHQEMGFEVIALETGFYDAIITNMKLQMDSVSIRDAKDHLIRGGWDRAKGAMEIFDYIKQSYKSDKPLHLSGFDRGRPPYGIQHYTDLLKETFVLFPKLKLSAEDSSIMSNVTHASCGYLGNEYLSKVTIQDYDKVGYVLYDIIEKIAEDKKWESPNPITSKEEALLFYLKSLYLDVQLAKLQSGGLAYNELRDKFMADRLRWLLDYFYPNKKIIVWAATGHLMKNNFQMEHSYAGYFNYQTYPLQMGDYLEHYGYDSYLIGFTTYSGQRGNIYSEEYEYHKEMTQVRDISQAPDGTYEYLIHSLGKPYLYTDIKSQPNNSWLKGKIRSHMWESEFEGRLHDMLDAFFYIDNMEPVYKIKK